MSLYQKNMRYGLLALASIILLFYARTLIAVKTELTVIGPIRMADGLGRQSVELMDALCDSLSINCIPTNQPVLQDVPERVAHILKTQGRQLGKVVVFEASLPNPHSKKFFKKLDRYLSGPKNDHQIRIAYPFIESTRIPEAWTAGLNCYFDAVVVADPWLVDVYRKSGVTTPIFVLPLGLDLNSFLEKPLKQQKNHPFCFMNLSSMIPRKNHEALIRAFHKAFGNNPDVELVMNYRTAAGGAIDGVKKLLNELKADNIKLTSYPLDKKDYTNFFQKADVFVSLAKGEGFSIQPREAMALGLPTILSDNSAHQTLVASGLACGISCPQEQPAYNAYLKCYCGVEYLVDEGEAVAKLLDVYHNYENYLKQAAARREWAQNYQFEKLKERYLNLVKPKQVILADHNEITSEALITSSIELYNKYRRLCS